MMTRTMMDAKWPHDLMCYFEVVNENENGKGWFYPDPLVETTYFVVET